MRLPLIVILSLLAFASTAVAGGVTVEFENPTVAVGDSFEVQICGTGGRMVDYTITTPTGSSSGQLWANDKCTLYEYALLIPATTAGTYTVSIYNKNGNKLLASASGEAA